MLGEGIGAIVPATINMMCWIQPFYVMVHSITVAWESCRAGKAMTSVVWEPAPA